jgi:hypothetical protein
MYEERFYRERHKSKDLHNYQIMINESDLSISSDVDVTREAEKALIDIRKRIEKACDEIEGFKDSLSPINKVSGDPIINNMINASRKAYVGPMASVAGTVSEYVVKEVINTSKANQIIVENGGDIYMHSKTDRKILVYAGASPFSNKIGIRIPKAMMPIGICTSAGTFGHSLSFGKADAALVLSKDTALADAAATSLGNIVKSPQDIKTAIDFGKSIDGILGILIIIGDKLGVWGDIEIFKAE